MGFSRMVIVSFQGSGSGFFVLDGLGFSVGSLAFQQDLVFLRMDIRSSYKIVGYKNGLSKNLKKEVD